MLFAIDIFLKIILFLDSKGRISMKAQTEIKIGIVAAIIAIVYYVFFAIGTALLTFCVPRGHLLFGGLLLLYLIPLSNFLLYIFALVKRRLTVAKWSYGVVCICVICSAMMPLLGTLFVKESSDGLTVYTILLILIIFVPVVLFLILLGRGISGLKKLSAEHENL